MTSNLNKENITFYCQDGYALSGTIYPASGEVNKQHAILFAPATGIKRGFYNSLASHLASLGYNCLSYDNRGIGDSLQGKLKDSQASLVDWGSQDLVAAFTELQQRFSNCKYHIIGHSAGGQLVGLIPDWQNITSVFNVACSSGQIDNMKNPFRLQARFFMDVFIPLSNKVFGYTKSEWVGMGEPLPKQVAQDWADWCNAEGYVEAEFGKRIAKHWFYDMTTPSVWLNATDDDIANNTNVDDMTRVFKNMPIERIILDPKNEGITDIGHMKFFSKKSAKLWVHLTDWLAQHA